MDHPDLTVSDFMGNSISTKRVTDVSRFYLVLSSREDPFLYCGTSVYEEHIYEIILNMDPRISFTFFF